MAHIEVRPAPVGLAPASQKQRARRWVWVGAAAALVWAIARAGIGDRIVNAGGWSNFVRFWEAAATPELSGSFLRLTLDATFTTLAMAVLGTALAIAIGIVGAAASSEVIWGDHPVRTICRAALVVPRAIHEVIWAVLAVQIFGFDPVVAVLAIGIPFGAVTAKVFADAIDETDREPNRLLRATGAGRFAALIYGILPTVRQDLQSYAFYRLECAVRAAAVLGVVGIGGLGFQLDLSFETLRYHEIWTLIVALMILSGLIDRWSTTVRRSSAAAVHRFSILAVVLMVPAAALWLRVNPGVLWSQRSRSLANDFSRDLLPPRLGPGGWSELVGSTIDTVALSLLALAISVVGGIGAAIVSRRRTEVALTAGAAQRVVAMVTRLLLLLARAVPPPIWAFLAVLIFFPGLWPGAIALAIYNLGVLGRLFADSFEDRDTLPTDQLLVTGAGPTSAFLYGALPTATPRLIALSLYRWEVIVRETVVVGVVGAGGLGQLINEHLAARDFAAVTGVIGALILLAFAADLIGAGCRRVFR